MLLWIFEVFHNGVYVFVRVVIRDCYTRLCFILRNKINYTNRFIATFDIGAPYIMPSIFLLIIIRRYFVGYLNLYIIPSGILLLLSLGISRYDFCFYLVHKLHLFDYKNMITLFLAMTFYFLQVSMWLICAKYLQKTKVKEQTDIKYRE